MEPNQFQLRIDESKPSVDALARFLIDLQVEADAAMAALAAETGEKWLVEQISRDRIRGRSFNLRQRGYKPLVVLEIEEAKVGSWELLAAAKFLEQVGAGMLANAAWSVVRHIAAGAKRIRASRADEPLDDVDEELNQQIEQELREYREKWLSDRRKRPFDKRLGGMFAGGAGFQLTIRVRHPRWGELDFMLEF